VPGEQRVEHDQLAVGVRLADGSTGPRIRTSEVRRNRHPCAWNRVDQPRPAVNHCDLPIITAIDLGHSVIPPAELGTS